MNKHDTWMFRWRMLGCKMHGPICRYLQFGQHLRNHWRGQTTMGNIRSMTLPWGPRYIQGKTRLGWWFHLAKHCKTAWQGYLLILQHQFETVDPRQSHQSSSIVTVSPAAMLCVVNADTPTGTLAKPTLMWAGRCLKHSFRINVWIWIRIPRMHRWRRCHNPVNVNSETIAKFPND